MKYFNDISIAFGIVGGSLAWLVGGWDVLLWTLVGFIILDYLTGLAKAWKTKKLSSEIGFEGLVKKMMILVMIVVANFLQRLIGDAVPLREIVILFFISNEGISLLENAAMFITVPDQLRDALLQLRDEDKEEK
ncbi:phage holin family protein [uncultured Trichococcus sp.]|uniref:phage holin family protein n=1 Tax=uncultured Trichococcus sp. TaxID=189665 RepID=UPI002A18E331|nr:phage holin family protein [uncultured Trichococcus sp.]